MNDETIELIAGCNPYPSELPAPPIGPVLARLSDEPGAWRGRARPLAGGRPWVRGRPRVRGRGVLVALAAAVPIVAVVVAIVSLGHGGRGQPGAVSHKPRVVNVPVKPKVGGVEPLPAVKAAVRPLSSILGVLRRPQTRVDRDPALIRQLRHDEHNTLRLGLLGRPVPSLMRLATVAPWGQPIYVVPFLPPTAAEKRRLPRKDRSITTASTVALQVYPAAGDKLTLFGNNPAPAAQIEGGRELGSGGHDAPLRKQPRRWIMVVPDGIARVALWNETGSIANHPRHPTRPGSKPIVVDVHDNIAAFVAPLRSFHGPGQEIWYGPSGNVVKRIDNADSCGPPLGNCS